MMLFAQLIATEITGIIWIDVEDELFTVQAMKKIDQILLELSLVKSFQTYKTPTFLWKWHLDCDVGSFI